MYFRDDEKDDKLKALQKLKDVMSSEMGMKMGKMKKPVSASLIIEKEGHDEPDEDNMDDGDEDNMRGMFGKKEDEDCDYEDVAPPSDEELNMMRKMLKKYS